MSFYLQSALVGSGKYIALRVVGHTELTALNSRTLLTRALLNRGAHCNPFGTHCTGGCVCALRIKLLFPPIDHPPLPVSASISLS